MYHISQQACNALLGSELEAGSSFCLTDIYQSSIGGCSQHQLSFDIPLYK